MDPKLSFLNDWQKNDDIEINKNIERELIQGRNGITKTIFGTSMRFSLENEFPLLTTKKMAWKTCHD